MSDARDLIEPLKTRALSAPARRLRYIVSFSQRISNLIALACTYTTPKNQLFTRMSLPGVRRRVASVHTLWVNRVWELCANDLWRLQRNLTDESFDDIDASKLETAFINLASCLCKCVVYKHYTKPSQPLPDFLRRSCLRRNFCPHCWAETARSHSRTALRELRDLIKKTNVVATTFVYEKTIPADIGGPAFADVDVFNDDVIRLRRYVIRLLRKCSGLSRSFNRYCGVGGAWRVVVIPHERHWTVQLRLFVLRRSSRKRPPKYAVAGYSMTDSRVTEFFTDMSVAQKRKAKLSLYSQLIAFNRYPIELLTEDIETTAAAVNAVTNLHLMQGAGCFRYLDHRLKQSGA